MLFDRIKMINLKRHRFVSSISIGLTLLALLLVYSEDARRFLSIGGILRGPFELPPKSNKRTGERYELVMKYEQDRLPEVPFKRILYWNDYFGIPDYEVGLGRDALRRWNCPVWQCETSNDRTDVEDYDAVVFHFWSWSKRDLPRRRSPHQRYIFWGMESAAWTETVDTRSMANFFNWTVTYRWDSDMVRPYGYVRPIGNVSLHPSESQLKEHLRSSWNVDYAAGKTKMAAWFVSRCYSRSSRDEMVHELQKHLQVDVYGRCGRFSCPKKSDENYSSQECQAMAAKNYKFYMSLENSLCLDYITEKFFGMLHWPIVPIVYGLHDHYDRIAPAHSFINAAKFESMKQLADYLILLDKNDTLYNEYFWWKPHFEVRYQQKDINVGACHLCASLHNTTIAPKTYANMTDWWETQAHCVFSPPIS